jgi:SAM-dependent methyltransferase
MTSAVSIPGRIRWVVDQLGVNANDHILEIGGGRGAAASLICPRLTQGSYLGIDRSATAVEASTAHNRQHVERGTARFDQAALEDLDPSALPRFDKVFASNVNVFWTHPAQCELALIRQLLTGKGELYLFYDSPEPARIRRLSRLLAEHLEQARYTHSLVTTMLTSSTVIGLNCRPLPIPDPRKEENP